MYSRIKEISEKYVADAIVLRRYLHQHPELSFQEYETTRFIKTELEKLGIEVFSPLETGCVGVIQGEVKTDQVIALRADIDALPIHEQGEAKKDFISKTPGVAHCCGHDAHTANLLTAARILVEMKDKIKGKILLVFQAGEEKLPGGGRLLCETGFLQKQKINAIYGLHTSPMMAAGKIATRSGPLMAGADEFEIEIIGKSGHAARAHEAIDPVVLSAQFINAVQTIASRSVDPTEPVVVTIGRIEGGTAHNIIPEKIKMWGTVRTLRPETAALVEKQLAGIAQGITKAIGGDYKLDYHKGYPPVINSADETRRVLLHAEALFGSENVIEMEKPMMAAEDFAFYQREFPGAFFFVGSNAARSDSGYAWHHPRFNVDDDFFKTALPLMVALALQ